MNINDNNLVDIVLWGWFALTALSVAYVAYDLVTSTPEMKVMKWGWILVTLYTGPIGLFVYWLSCREPRTGTHEEFIAPLWKQSVGSTIHCLAGDATGIIVAAAVTSLLRLPMGIDAVVEYVTGFAFGLFIFQALFMKDVLNTSYVQAVRRTSFAEWVSMNAVMAGMTPVMVILMSRDMRAMEPKSLRFWGVMSLATLVGAVLAYPVNRWLVSHGIKHGMGTERVLGRGGSKVEGKRAQNVARVPTDTLTSAAGSTTGHQIGAMPRMSGMDHGTSAKMPMKLKDSRHTAASPVGKTVVALITVAMLAGGVVLAARFGDLSMRAGESMDRMPMEMPHQMRK